jgi:hypothetical protein
MTITYQLTEEDLLLNQLYAASQSATLKKRRRYMRWLLVIAYVGIGLFALQNGDWIFGSSVCIVGVLWYFLYPLYAKRNHTNHYKKFIRENQSNLIGQEIELTIENDFIFAKDVMSESKINISAVLKLVELKEHIIISMQGSTIVVPKKYIADQEGLKHIFHLKGIQFVDDSRWAWK